MGSFALVTNSRYPVPLYLLSECMGGIFVFTVMAGIVGWWLGGANSPLIWIFAGAGFVFGIVRSFRAPE